MHSLQSLKSSGESVFIYNDIDRELKVIDSLEEELRKCVSFDFSVAFITQEGVQSLLQTMDNRRDHIHGRILTSDYLNFNEPKALRKLQEFENIEVRIFPVEKINTGFHTKGYMFYHLNEISVIIGSSNLTANALSKNKEWNVKLTSEDDSAFIESIREEFEVMWNVSNPLTSQWIDTYELRFEKSFNERKRAFVKEKGYDDIIIPNKMQEEALLNLTHLRERGVRKALLISATGTGKTFLSAFDVRNSGAKKVLFLVHREQILDDAIRSYKLILGCGIKVGKIAGSEKDWNADFIFSTTQSMSKDYIQLKFKPDYFDYIVYDEAHHTVAESNSKIHNYFRPKFELGMTATPERPDGANVFELFDNNIAYEIRLQEALKQDMLCPFHYYGISDIMVNGRSLNDKEDLNNLTSDERVKHIMEKAAFYGYSGKRVKGLIFCRDIEDGQVLSKKMNEKGWRTVFLQGSDSIKDRKSAVDRLEQDENDNALDYILTVNIFNEGIDIKKVNQIIMLRPTQSSIIFIQQLGRGLRIVDDPTEKEYLVVIDFIGNYENNYLIPVALSGDTKLSKEGLRRQLRVGTIPGCSTISFDTIAEARIYESINSTRNLFKLVRDKYRTLVKMRGYEPNLTQLYELNETSTSPIDPLEIVKITGTFNDFKKSLKLKYYDFTNEEIDMLKFISKDLMKGFRPQELMIISEVINKGSVDLDQINEKILSRFGIESGETTLDSAVSVLDGSYAKNDNIGGPIVVKSGSKIFPSPILIENLKTDGFKESVEDCISCGLAIYEHKYKAMDNSPFIHYERYGRYDVIRLLNFKEKIVAQNIGGYFADKTLHVCPIFVTYQKSADINKSVQYEDRFINYELFSWYSKNKRHITSPDVQEILDPRCKSYLFIQKGDDDTSDFYYIGKVTPIEGSAKESTIVNDEGKPLSIVNIKMAIDRPVPDKIFTYLTE